MKDEKTIEEIARAMVTAEGGDPEEMVTEHIFSEEMVPAWHLKTGLARGLIAALDIIRRNGDDPVAHQ